MGNFAFAILNRAASGTITVSSEGAHTRGILLQDPHPRRRWIVASGTSPTVSVDMGSAVPMSTFAVIAPVASGGTPTMRVRLSNSAPGSAGDLYDSSTSGITTTYSASYQEWVHMAPGNVSARYVHFAFANLIGAGVLFCGPRGEFSINYAPGFRRTPIVNSRFTKGDAGQSFVDYRYGAWANEGQAEMLSQTDYDAIIEAIDLARVTGSQIASLFIRDTESTDARDYSWGHVIDGGGVEHHAVVDRYNFNFRHEQRV